MTLLSRFSIVDFEQVNACGGNWINVLNVVLNDTKMTSFGVNIDFEHIEYSTENINLALLLTTLNKYLRAGLSVVFQFIWVQPFNT